MLGAGIAGTIGGGGEGVGGGTTASTPCRRHRTVNSD